MENGESLITQLKKVLTVMDERLTSVEHTVNDVIIGSLKESAEEYDDNEKYNTFKDNYGELITPLVEPYKVMCGDDFDVERSLYDNLKEVDGYGSDDFDEKGIVEAQIAEIEAKLDELKKLNNIKEDNAEDGKVAESEPIDKEKPEEEKEEEIPSDEQLAKELKAAMNN